jgi:hypothetical protein
VTAVEDILAHHGVKGQKWGVIRRSKSSGPTKISADAKKFAKASEKVKTHGTKSLSNDELKLLTARMNLEKQFKTLKPPTKSQAVAKFLAKFLLDAGKQQASVAVNAHIAKQIAILMKK